VRSRNTSPIVVLVPTSDQRMRLVVLSVPTEAAREQRLDTERDPEPPRAA
jgi:hypothetical protein